MPLELLDEVTKVKSWGKVTVEKSGESVGGGGEMPAPGIRGKTLNGMARSGVQPVPIFSVFFPPHPDICFLLTYDNFLLHFGNLATQ